MRTRTVNVLRIPGTSQTVKLPVPDRGQPLVIFAAMLDRTLGDFFDRNIYAATVKMCFKQAQLIAYYRKDRPYKADIVAMNPYIDQHIVANEHNVLPIEMFYGNADRFSFDGSDYLIKQGAASPHILLVPSTMMQEDLLRFAHIPQFAIPQDRKAALEERLVGLGLDSSRWFCVIFHRDPTYRFRGPTPYRDTNDQPFEVAARHIIDELGGQVVRLGHPQMRRFDLPRDFIDLSVVENEFMLHATAVSRARFMISAPAGPASLPGVFDVPHVITNGVTLPASRTPIGYLLPRHVFSPEGKRFDVPRMAGKGWWNDNGIRQLMNEPGYRVLENTAEELCAAANFIHEQTQDCPGWRPKPSRRLHTPPEHYDAHGPFLQSTNIIEFPELWPRAPR